MSPSRVPATLILALATLAAGCRGTSPVSDVKDATAASDHIIDCAFTPPDGSTFYIHRSTVPTSDQGVVAGPAAGTLICTRGNGILANAGAVLFTCTENPTAAHAGTFAATVTAVGDGTVSTHLTNAALTFDATVACTDNDPPPPATIPAYADVAPAIQGICVTCHVAPGIGQNPPLNTQDGVEAARGRMLTVLDSGFMPLNQPVWHTTDVGQQLTTWLRYGN